jgi:hypothetical protein
LLATVYAEAGSGIDESRHPMAQLFLRELAKDPGFLLAPEAAASLSRETAFRA